MLDAFIIEELKKREEQRRRELDRRPVLELPIDEDDPCRESEKEEPILDDPCDDDQDDKRGRGVVIIDFGN
jgi:hypothetical protein